MTRSHARMQPAAARLPPGLLAGVALAHAGLLAALLHMPRSVVPITLPQPLTVSLIVSGKEPQPQPRSEPRPQQPSPAVTPLPPPVPVAERPAPMSQPVIDAPRPAPASSPVPEVPAASAPVAVDPPILAPPALQTTIPPHPADYLNNPRPPYPSLSRRQGEQGTVRLNILVNPDGSVARLELLMSSGYPRLDKSAIETVQSSWKFEPARQGGNPVAAWVIVPIQFTLRS